jgi:hypothetical protein
MSAAISAKPQNHGFQAWGGGSEVLHSSLQGWRTSTYSTLKIDKGRQLNSLITELKPDNFDWGTAEPGKKQLEDETMPFAGRGRGRAGWGRGLGRAG